MRHIILLLLLLTSCTCQPKVIEKNITIEKEVIIEKEIIKYVNISIHNDSNSINPTQRYSNNKSYVLSLIRQLKHCESQIDRDFNLTDYKWKFQECNKTLNATIIDLENCKDTCNDN